jgi:23S rRNA maturation mini-RNase III
VVCIGNCFAHQLKKSQKKDRIDTICRRGKNANGSSQKQQSLLEFYSQNPPLTAASN